LTRWRRILRTSTGSVIRAMSFIIHGEPGVPPAKEGSGELLADEAPRQE
jgi:hypothetical protein